MVEGFQEGDLADIQILYNDIDGQSAVVYFPPKEDYECGSMCVADLNDKGAYVKSSRNWINHTLDERTRLLGKLSSLVDDDPISQENIDEKVYTKLNFAELFSLLGQQDTRKLVQLIPPKIEES